MSQTRRTPGRPRSAEADEAILDAAIDLLIENGIDGTSIEQVARRAGVTRATVYRRYADRTALLVAAIHWCYRYQPEELPEPRDVEQMLSWWAQAIEDPAYARIRRVALRLGSSLHDHPEFRETFRTLSIEPRNAWIHRTLERERDRGRFPPDTDLDIVRQILAGAVATHLTNHPEGSTTREAEEFFLAVLRETRFRPDGHQR